jgi:hypothetical protein
MFKYKSLYPNQVQGTIKQLLRYLQCRGIFLIVYEWYVMQCCYFYCSVIVIFMLCGVWRRIDWYIGADILGNMFPPSSDVCPIHQLSRRHVIGRELSSAPLSGSHCVVWNDCVTQDMEWNGDHLHIFDAKCHDWAVGTVTLYWNTSRFQIFLKNRPFLQVLRRVRKTVKSDH